MVCRIGQNQTNTSQRTVQQQEKVAPDQASSSALPAQPRRIVRPFQSPNHLRTQVSLRNFPESARLQQIA